MEILGETFKALNSSLIGYRSYDDESPQLSNAYETDSVHRKIVEEFVTLIQTGNYLPYEATCNRLSLPENGNTDTKQLLQEAFSDACVLTNTICPVFVKRDEVRDAIKAALDARSVDDRSILANEFVKSYSLVSRSLTIQLKLNLKNEYNYWYLAFDMGTVLANAVDIFDTYNIDIIEHLSQYGLTRDCIVGDYSEYQDFPFMKKAVKCSTNTEAKEKEHVDIKIDFEPFRTYVKHLKADRIVKDVFPQLNELKLVDNKEKAALAKILYLCNWWNTKRPKALKQFERELFALFGWDVTKYRPSQLDATVEYLKIKHPFLSSLDIK